MMPRMHPSAVLSSGFLLLSTGLSSCTFLPMFSSGGQETPRTLGARMEKHTEVLQKDIGERNDHDEHGACKRHRGTVEAGDQGDAHHSAWNDIGASGFFQTIIT